MLGIGQLVCVSYDVVCGMFYYVDCEKAMINEDDRQERELRRLASKHILDVSRILFLFFLNLCMSL